MHWLSLSAVAKKNFLPLFIIFDRQMVSNGFQVQCILIKAPVLRSLNIQAEKHKMLQSGKKPECTEGQMGSTYKAESLLAIYFMPF